MTNNESKGPFEGLLVIDMTHVLNGPFGTQLLCNMGARVIKVEPPGHGDDTRTFGPYVDGQSLYYSFINHGNDESRNKNTNKLYYGLPGTSVGFWS
jgi:CoA:oxalate CoA-transferase